MTENNNETFDTKACEQGINIDNVKNDSKFVKILEVITFDSKNNIIDKQFKIDCLNGGWINRNCFHSPKLFDKPKLSKDERLESLTKMRDYLLKHIENELQEIIIVEKQKLYEKYRVYQLNNKIETMQET